MFSWRCSITCRPAAQPKHAKASQHLTRSARQTGQLVSGSGGWNDEMLDLLFDFAREIRRTSPVDDPMIECQRNGNHFCAVVLLSVYDDLTMSRTDKERSN